MPTKYNIDDLTSDLSKLEAGKVDLVILFNSRKVSNDIEMQSICTNMQLPMTIEFMYAYTTDMNTVSTYFY